MKNLNFEKLPTMKMKGGQKGGQKFNTCLPMEKDSYNIVSIKKEIWLTVKEAGQLLGIPERTVKYHCKSGKYTTKLIEGNGGKQYRILLSSLPSPAQAKYWSEKIQSDPDPQDSPDELTAEMEIYNNAPAWARETIDKYLSIIRSGLKGKGLKLFIESWNKSHPEQAATYPSVIRAKARYEKYGVAGLKPGYGKRAGKSSIDDEWFVFYKDLYLNQGLPSVKTCWRETFACFHRQNPDLLLKDFPAAHTFDYRLKAEISASAIYLARYGKEKWNKKYANYLDRDYSAIQPGECYISDHAQIDVAVSLPSGKFCFPWVTAWRDFRSGKWVGWMVHSESPCSDHIFQSFFYSCRDHGLPTDVYIDNGKDYRCRDFAGGRKKSVAVKVDEIKTTSTLGILNITPHFAIPYNAQTKSIERDFLKVKEWFSKNMPGYRGGKVTERPEILKEELKNGSVLSLNELTAAFDDFIINILNRMESKGKVLKGMCPDELWEKERILPRMVSNDALTLFCMRTSKDYTIGRNGVKDSETGCFYWNEWMAGMKGSKVYLRRDLKAYQEAWVFASKTDEYIGKATMAATVPALARTNIEKAQIKEAMASKKRAEKIEKSLIETRRDTSYEDKISLISAYAKAANEARGYEPSEERPKVVSITRTPMDEVVRKANEEKKEVSKLKYEPYPKPKRKFFHLYCEREEAERRQGEEEIA